MLQAVPPGSCLFLFFVLIPGLYFFFFGGCYLLAADIVCPTSAADDRGATRGGRYSEGSGVRG